MFCFNRADPGSGNLVTFAQFAFIALEGFIFTSKFGREPLRIGYSSYIFLVVMFFVTSVCNNYAFDFNIPMPLHMIFRAVSYFLTQIFELRFQNKKIPLQGSLIANMIMGIIILRRRYDFSKYLSVVMITLGIVICTIISGSSVVSSLNSTICPSISPEIIITEKYRKSRSCERWCRG